MFWTKLKFDMTSNMNYNNDNKEKCIDKHVLILILTKLKLFLADFVSNIYAVVFFGDLTRGPTS